MGPAWFPGLIYICMRLQKSSGAPSPERRDSDGKAARQAPRGRLRTPDWRSVQLAAQLAARTGFWLKMETSGGGGRDKVIPGRFPRQPQLFCSESLSSPADGGVFTWQQAKESSLFTAALTAR